MSGLEELLENAMSGDRQAVDAIVAQFSGVIDRECKKYGYWAAPDWDHSDMVQDVLLRVWSRLDQFRGATTVQLRPAFIDWIKKTTKSVLINQHRSRLAKKRKPAQPNQLLNEETQVFVSKNGHSDTPSSIFSHKEDANQLQEALSSELEVESVSVLTMKIVQGMSFKEIAQRLGLTYDQVRYRYETSIQKLESKLRSSK